jgi:hypothetical protein
MEPISELFFNMIAIMGFYKVKFTNSKENLNDEVSKIKTEENSAVSQKGDPSTSEVSL